MKNSDGILRIMCFLLLMPVSAAAENQSAFTVLYRYWHEPSETLLDEARVTYSPQGLRVEQLQGDSGNVFIANYAEDAFWFLDSRRRLVHSIPLVVTPADPSDEVSLSSDASYSGPFSMIQVEPCEGLEKQLVGETIFQGRAVQRWSCLFDQERVEEHWYARNPGLVVRTQTSEGFVSELTEIQERHAVNAYFRPPSHYRPVEIEELINPAVPISSYIEK